MPSPSTATFLLSLRSRTRMNSLDRETVSVPSISDKFENTTNVTSRHQPYLLPDLLPDLRPNHPQNHQSPNARRKVAPVETSGHSVGAWMISARIISWSAKIVAEHAGSALVSCRQTKQKGSWTKYLYDASALGVRQSLPIFNI